MGRAIASGRAKKALKHRRSAPDIHDLIWRKDAAQVLDAVDHMPYNMSKVEFNPPVIPAHIQKALV
jgi:hypothetical protein